MSEKNEGILLAEQADTPFTEVEELQALVYLMVAVTLASGADYFLNFRRRIEEAQQRVAAQAASGAAGSGASAASRSSSSSRVVPRM